MAAVIILEKANALLAVRILTLMAQHHLSVYGLAQRACLRVSTAHRICAGEMTHPSVWTIQAIALAFGVTVDALIGTPDA